jgi:hypothetical protein
MTMSTPPRTNDPAAREEGGFNSKLSAPRERFLAAIVEHALLVGRRSAKDFLKAFPARDIMYALRDQPRLRAKLLVTTTGLNEKVALKKAASSAGEDLEIALNERVTEEDDVVALFDPDDRVRYLDHTKLWNFLIEGEFWRITADNVPVSVAREHVAYIVSRARAEKLITDREIIDGITLDVLVDSLPKEELGRVIERALAEGRSGRVFKDERVLDVLSPYLLVEHVSLAHIWHRLIADRLAFKSGGSTTTSGWSNASNASSHASAPPTPPAPPSSSPSITVGVASISEPSTSTTHATLPDKDEEKDVEAKEKDKDGPISVKLDLSAEEEIIIDDEKDEVTSNEVDALLAKVVVSDSSTMPEPKTESKGEGGRNDFKLDPKEKENGAPRSQRPSRPPPA